MFKVLKCALIVSTFINLGHSESAEILIGKAMEKTKRGLLWEEEFRRFLLKTILRYGISSELEKMKAELMAKGEKWPDEAFEASKSAAKRAAIAAAIIKSEA